MDDMLPEAQSLAEVLIAAAWEGRLTREMLEDVAGEGGSWRQMSLTFMTRAHFVMKAGWWLPTVDYLDALASFLGRSRVVEVCAGNGLVGKLMRERGVDWICTDLEPWEGSEGVIKMDAREAIRKFNPSIVFAAWIPCESTLDYEIARLGKPCLIVGEGRGGCTGSEKFWERARKDGYAIQACPFEIDVPSWHGIHDRTHWVVPIWGGR